MDFPDSLITDIARRRSVIFLGSGVSRNATSHSGRSPKTWHQFLDDAKDELPATKHVRQLLNEKDYLTACEVIKNGLGSPRFNELLRDEYLTPGYQAARIHEHIFRIDSRIVATPNFDKIYETYANHASAGSVITKNYYDPDVAECVRGTDRVIIKVHGSIDSANRMIFTRREYAQARQDNGSFYSLLEALILTHTFVFIGCGLNDPDIRLLLENSAFRYPGSRPHYFILPSQTLHRDVRSTIESSMNLKVLTYPKSGDHHALVDALENLAGRVEDRREDLRTNMNW